MFRAAESGLPTDLRKLISRKFSTAQDKCGRTVLHRAILKKSKHVIKFLAENYTNIIDIPDNVNNNVFFSVYFFLKHVLSSNNGGHGLSFCYRIICTVY